MKNKKRKRKVQEQKEEKKRLKNRKKMKGWRTEEVKEGRGTELGKEK